MQNEFEKIRIVFIGTTDFSTVILKTLCDNGYNVVAAVSQPDKPSGRRQLVAPSPVHRFCMEQNLLCLQPEKLRLETEAILALQPDCIITCAYGQMVPAALLKAPSYGCLNIHPSLLPKYRGGAPMHRAIWAGETETGVCLMQMVEKMDAGAVYASAVLPIGRDETLTELEARLKQTAAALLQKELPKYLRGELKGIPQDDAQAVIARTIAKEEEQVFFAKETGEEAYNHIRALTAWPMSYGLIDGKRIKFVKARFKQEDSGSLAGTVLGFREGAMEIAAKGGVIRILELQPEGKKAMSAKDFANGAGRALIGRRFA